MANRPRKCNCVRCRKRANRPIAYWPKDFIDKPIPYKVVSR